jgi:CRISPR-associated protein Cas2
MRCFLVYDIPHDGKRGKIADACLDYGLDRVQFSAFMGELRATHRDELMLKVKKILGKQPGKVLLFAINATDWEARHEIVQEIAQAGAAQMAAANSADDGDDEAI